MAAVPIAFPAVNPIPRLWLLLANILASSDPELFCITSCGVVCEECPFNIKMLASDALVRVAFTALRAVVVSVPVEGLKLSLVEDTLSGGVPVMAVTQVGYMVALVLVSSATNPDGVMSSSAIYYVYCTSNQQSAEPIVLVGPVLELQIVMPVDIALPLIPKSIEKLLVAGTVNVITGTAVSAGSDAVLWICINCEDVFELYPESPHSVPAEALATLDAS